MGVRVGWSHMPCLMVCLDLAGTEPGRRVQDRLVSLATPPFLFNCMIYYFICYYTIM
jgi:hypothetical protein